MTDHFVEVPFDVVTKWEKIEGSCARLYAAAEWGYKQALATPPPEPPTDQELVAFLYLIDPEDELSPLAMVRAALERWGNNAI